MPALRTRVARLLRAKLLAQQRRSTDPAPDERPGPLDDDAPASRELPELARARAVLGVAEDADADSLKRAYRALCHRYHPDRFAGDPGRFETAGELLSEINRAYELLTRAGKTS